MTDANDRGRLTEMVASLDERQLGSGNLFGVVVQRARVCLACGHVALALDAPQLAKLRAAIAGLASS